MMEQNQEYAGFWIRVGAALIDTLLILLILGPALTMIYGSGYWLSDQFIQGFWDLMLGYILPAIAVVVFWVYKSATPGKMATRLTIVDARTGQKPTTTQFIIRYLGYFVSIIPLFFGIIWVAIDERKQGWHDKIAGTVVLRRKETVPVRFEGA